MDLKLNSLFKSPAIIRLNVVFNQPVTFFNIFAIQKLIVTREYSLNYLFKNTNVYWQYWDSNFAFKDQTPFTPEQFAIFGSSFSDYA